MSSERKERGLFIVFEGLDHSGKTTQCEALYRALVACSIPAEKMHFPDRTTFTGKHIDEYLQMKAEEEKDDHYIHLLFSANRWETVSKIKKTLESGVTIVCDRYAFSGVAFSSAKGLDPKWCIGPDIGLPAPDVVVYLEIDPAKAAERGNFGKEIYERIEFQRKVATEFEKMKDNSWLCLNAMKDRNEIRDEVVRRLLSLSNRQQFTVDRLLNTQRLSLGSLFQ